MSSRKNYKGEELGDKRRVLSNPAYGNGKVDKNGDPEVVWKRYITVKHDHGFDRSNKEANGKYLIEIELPKGTEILRYGTEAGNYTAPKGTPYEKLALPYLKETLEYNEYRVITDGLKVKCQVKKGVVAPSLDSSGGAVQYWHYEPIYLLVRKKALKRIDLWAEENLPHVKDGY